MDSGGRQQPLPDNDDAGDGHFSRQTANPVPFCAIEHHLPIEKRREREKERMPLEWQAPVADRATDQ